MTEPATGSNNKHILVIGGGIAGLAAALRIRALDPSCAVTIADAGARLGGKIAGEMLAGCVVDGGADVCIGDKLRATHMFAQLGLAERVIRVNPNSLPTYDLREGQLQRSAASYDGELLTFPHGMREIVDAACDALDGVVIATDTSIATVRPDHAAWQAAATSSRTFVADAVILATPAPAIATLLNAIAPHQAADIGALEYPPLTTVTMAWHADDVPRDLDGTGYLAADPGSAVTACTWTSSKNPSHAPPGVALLRGYVRGVGGDAAAFMLEESATVLGVTALPMFTRIYEWPAGIPVYDPAHDANVRALSDCLRATPGLFIAGSAFHGVGIPDCITSGERAAESAVTYLATRQPERA
ncbi:MAG: FAD-dependent oxidoreductase [Gemmatimonadaceae bacterium]